MLFYKESGTVSLTYSVSQSLVTTECTMCKAGVPSLRLSLCSDGRSLRSFRSSASTDAGGYGHTDSMPHGSLQALLHPPGSGRPVTPGCLGVARCRPFRSATYLQSALTFCLISAGLLSSWGSLIIAAMQALSHAITVSRLLSSAGRGWVWGMLSSDLVPKPTDCHEAQLQPATCASSNRRKLAILSMYRSVLATLIHIFPSPVSVRAFACIHACVAQA